MDLYRAVPAVQLKPMSDHQHFSGRSDPPVARSSALQRRRVLCDCKRIAVSSSDMVSHVTIKSVSSTKSIAGIRSSLADIANVRKVPIFS